MSGTTSLNGSEPILYITDVHLVVSLALCPYKQTRTHTIENQRWRAIDRMFASHFAVMLAHRRQGDRPVRGFHLPSE